MHKSIYLVVLLPIASFASSFTFSGAFTEDDNLLQYQFTIAAASTVSLESFSYAGNGSTVPAGGFAPVLAVFGPVPSADPFMQGFDDGGAAPGACGDRSIDPVTHSCLDAELTFVSLAPGTYLVTLTENDNAPIGPNFSDGFVEAGNGNFTGINEGFAGESFLDPNDSGVQRTPNFDFTISGVDSAQSASSPEPSTVSLLIAGLGLLTVKRKMLLRKSR